MPPASSKKRSRTMVSCVGRQPSAACPAARYSTNSSAAAGIIANSSISQLQVVLLDRTRLRLAAAAAQHPVDAVMMDERTAPAAAGAEAVGQHLHDSRKILPRQVPIRPCSPHQRAKLVLAIFTCCDLGDDLLRQHVERLLRNG